MQLSRPLRGPDFIKIDQFQEDVFLEDFTLLLEFLGVGSYGEAGFSVGGKDEVGFVGAGDFFCGGGHKFINALNTTDSSSLSGHLGTVPHLPLIMDVLDVSEKVSIFGRKV